MRRQADGGILLSQEAMRMTDEKGVQSIERALDIIESVAEEQDGKHLTAIAEETGLHKSTAHRIIMTLVGRGYLTKTVSGNYRLGFKLIEEASCYINHLELQTEARPYIAEISAHLGMSAYLGMLEGDKVIYIEKMHKATPEKLYRQIGAGVPAYCSSLGKCILSGYSKAQLEEIMADCSFMKFTEKTIDNMDALHRELNKVRSQGWAIDDEEYEKGHRCIGVPVYDYRGEIVAAVSVSGEKHVLTDERMPEIAEYLMEKAGQLSRDMGYTG